MLLPKISREKYFRENIFNKIFSPKIFSKTIFSPKNIFTKNILAKNIVAKNILSKIFSKKLTKNIFKKILKPNIFLKKRCCPQGLGWYRAIARSQPSITNITVFHSHFFNKVNNRVYRSLQTKIRSTQDRNGFKVLVQVWRHQISTTH